MEQELIKPDSAPRGSSQAFSPLGCFIAASVWAFSKLLGLPDMLANGLMVLSLAPAIVATVWTAGRAWHVERRLAQHQDIDVPVFDLWHYFKKAS
jgi:hypothetical protein